MPASCWPQTPSPIMALSEQHLGKLSPSRGPPPCFLSGAHVGDPNPPPPPQELGGGLQHVCPLHLERGNKFSFRSAAVPKSMCPLRPPPPASFRYFRQGQVWEVTFSGSSGNNTQQIIPTLWLLGCTWASTAQAHSATVDLSWSGHLSSSLAPPPGPPSLLHPFPPPHTHTVSLSQAPPSHPFFLCPSPTQYRVGEGGSQAMEHGPALALGWRWAAGAWQASTSLKTGGPQGTLELLLPIGKEHVMRKGPGGKCGEFVARAWRL